MLTCPAAELVDGSNLLYYEQVSTTLQFCVSSFVLIVFNAFIISSIMFFFMMLGFLEESTQTLSPGW